MEEESTESLAKQLKKALLDLEEEKRSVVSLRDQIEQRRVLYGKQQAKLIGMEAVALLIATAFAPKTSPEKFALMLKIVNETASYEYRPLIVDILLAAYKKAICDIT